MNTQQTSRFLLAPPDCPQKLPASISGIEVQQKNNQRCSIFVNQSFLIGIDLTVLLEFGLKKGDTLSEEIWQQLWLAEQQRYVYLWMISRLESRAHSAKELEQKAKQKGFPESWIQQALNQIQQKNLLNEFQFAKNHYQNKLQFKQWGPVKIRAYLKQKGISDSIIKQVELELDEENSDNESLSLLENIAAKKWEKLSRESDNRKRKEKLTRFLLQRGFAYDSIGDIIKKY
jgi:regulatory protein